MSQASRRERSPASSELVTPLFLLKKLVSRVPCSKPPSIGGGINQKFTRRGSRTNFPTAPKPSSQSEKNIAETRMETAQESINQRPFTGPLPRTAPERELLVPMERQEEIAQTLYYYKEPESLRKTLPAIRRHKEIQEKKGGNIHPRKPKGRFCETWEKRTSHNIPYYVK